MANINYSQHISQELRTDIAAYALEHGLSANDLIELAANAPDDLAKLGFHIEDSPTITIPLSVDEVKLEKALETEMKKQTPAARITDVNSLTAVYRLRDGLPKRYLEKCDAIFITTNKAMADISTRFFQNHFKEEGQTNIVQLCMTDIVFSMRLWPKLPTPATSLPKNQVISCALSNLIPSNTVLNSFFKIIRQLSEKGKLTDEVEAQILLSRFTEQTLVLELDENVRDLSERQAISVLQKIINKQKDFLLQIKEDEKLTVRRETERQIEKLVDELDRVHVEEEVRSAKLSSMVENIKEQAVLIKSYGSILNNTKRRVSVFSGIVLNIAIIFIVAWFVNYCFSFFGGFGWVVNR